MGRLIGLELHNFKSYKGTVKVGFGDSNFTSIIGPNGSGKSNMMDAISFVLGVRSSHLRSNVLKDLIYRGVLEENESSGLMGNEDDNNPQHAYVKALYLKGDVTVDLMRGISKSGDTTYRMNGKVVNYKRYASFLEDENILIKAKNFLVFQGDVVAIASQSATDLSHLFEEISGSIQYKKEYESLKERVHNLSLTAAESIKNRRRVHSELKTYREGINKNQEYTEKLREKIELEEFLALWQLYHLEQKKSGYNNKLKEFKTQIKQLKEKIGDEEKSLTRSRSSYTKDSTIIAKEKNTLEFKMREKEKVNSQLLPIKLSQRASAKRISNIEKKIEALQKDIERQQFYVSKFENQLNVVTKAKETFEKELTDSAKSFDKYKLTDDELKTYKELNEKYLNIGGFDLESRMSLLGNSKEEIQSDIQLLEKRLHLSKSRITDELGETRERLDSQMIELTSTLNEKNTLHSEQISELKRLQSEIESSSNKEYDLNYKLREALIKLDELSANQRETNKERKLRENVATLKKYFPGVRGLVSDLCEPKKDRYALAVSTILGKNFDSVIVDSLSVAQECIAFLKKQRAGIISLIPLDTLDVEIPIFPVADTQGCILSINAIKYDQEYERAMQYVCSDSIICDTLAIAQDLKWNKKIKSKLVTLEGSLIHRAGLMTGGISRDGGNRWDREEYQSLMTLKDKLLLEIEETSSYSRNCSFEARNLEGSLSMLVGDISSVRTQISQLKRSIEENRTETKYHEDLINEKYKPELDKLNEKVLEIENSIHGLEHEKEDLQNIVFKEFTTRLGFTIKEFENHSGEIIRQQNKELQELQRQILNIENKIEFEKERLVNTEERFEKTQEDLAKVKVEFESLRLQEENVQKQEQTINQEIDGYQKELKRLEKILDAKQRDILSAEEVLDNKNSSLQMLKRQRDETKDEIEKFTLERICILKNCKIANMDLPVSSVVGLHSLPIDSIDDQSIEIANEIKIDYEKLPAKYKESESNRVQKELEKNIKEVNESLNDLQPNANASHRFDEAQGKFEAIDHETEQLKTEERKTLAQFLKIKKKRKTLFEEAYEYVSEHIDAVYRELTKNPHTTSELAGGSASLTLEDEDEPFNAGIKYHATPPLKRFKDMEYLSGGEKTVAALALLFTINSYQPSPFFVLDEVDAALDTANVERIATYIKRHGNSDLQFIVISLKNTMFEKSDALVGVYREQQMNTSRIVTLNLNNYAS